MGLTSLVLAVTLGFGCGGPESEVGAPEAGDRNAALPTASATTLGAAEYPGVLAEIGVALSDIPEAQWPLLADGEVTFADYERAMLAHIACLAEHGIEVDGAAELDPSGTRLVFSPVHAGSDPGAARQSLETTMACWEEHAGVVAQVWAWVTEPTVDELQQAMKALVTCLEDSGAALPEDPAAQDTMLYQFEYRPCFEQVQAEFRIAGFVGYGS